MPASARPPPTAPCAIEPRFVETELKRLHLNKWMFIRECCHAERCSVNICPLDPLIALRTADPYDPETRCTLSKGDRERAFSRLTPEMQALLPFGGLFESEFARREAGRRRQASLTPEQLEKQREALAAARRAQLLRPRITSPDSLA